MHTHLRALVPLLLLVSLLSCKKDDVIYYNDVSFVNAAGGVYKTDAGLQYIPVENTSGKELPEEGRLILSCDILRKVSTGVYNVRVTGLAVPLTKAPVPAAVPDADDPVEIETGWFSGGYLNALLGFYMKDASEIKHLLNLEYTLPTESNDTLYLYLRHNALGEQPADPEDEDDDYSYVRTYACFRLDGLLPEGTEAPVKVEWKWYDGKDGESLLYRIRNYKVKLLF